ncbi:MAG: hypothetical protein LBS59_08170 [Puniceicoccales bacterium]|jgi:hypothetical protein|nr:hypothetical protein [Puniceicoccales bacterium]
MTLSLAYVFLGVALLVPGTALLSGSAFMTNKLRTFHRSTIAGVLFFGGAAAWFIWILYNLSDSDLAGLPRNWMLVFFGATALLAFRFLRDLIAIRGIAALILLSSRELLDVAYMQQPYSLVLASTTYLLIVLSIICGALPYVFHNWLDWTLSHRIRSVIAGSGISLVGAINITCAFLTP